MVRIMPQSARGEIERADTAAGLAVGCLAALLTFPVVACRRPRSCRGWVPAQRVSEPTRWSDWLTHWTWPAA